MLKHVLARLRGIIRAYIDLPLPPFFILTDVGSGAVLTMGRSEGPVVFLQQTIPDTKISSWANYPHYPYYFPLAQSAPTDYPRWTYTKDRMLVPTHAGVLTDRLSALSQLATAKHTVLAKMFHNINGVRSKRAAVTLQEFVYLKKQLEAERFRASGYDEKDILSYPYLLQYADFAQMSLRAAADETLLKAKLEDNELAKTEFLRLKYFDKVKNAQTPEELPAIREEFDRELYINAII